MTDPSLPLLLSVPQVMEQTGIKSRDTVYRLIAAGEFDTCDISAPGVDGKPSRSRTRVTRDSLERFISRRTTTRQQVAS